MRIFITISIVFSLLQLKAQDSLLSNKTIFKEGVYLTYKDFATNSPGLKVSTGEINKFNSKRLLELIMDDKELYTEYLNMSDSKRRKKYSILLEHIIRDIQLKSNKVE